MRESLRRTRLIAGREFRLLLGTPVFWVLAGVFFLAGSFVFIGLILGFSSDAFREENDLNADITVSVIHQLFYILHFFLLIQIPILTMRSLAEERRQRTLALLRTTTAGEWEIILGKFLANSAALLLYLTFTLVFPVITALISDPDWPVVAACYGALVLAIVAYVALGVFVSSLTDSQVIAAVLSYVALFSLIVLAGLADAFASPSLSLVSSHLTVLAHLEGFLEGNAGVADAAYFILFAFLFLFLGARQLESLRWRS
ncbi:ABC transporter permease subunit [Candidatus Poribacteria bacterium]|nr:ABC transporter permease subunit [Candidatus Poribacteria bacterium]